MKNALMIVSTVPYVNIGDYIQAVAASQFLDKIDVYIERERMNSYRGENVKMIMNGWYMHQPQNWPPSDLIHPLFVAFHINSSAKKQMLSDESIAYLKSHQPIGCRDTYTMALLKSKDVEAYFSACLTLTLGKKYYWEGKRDGKCYFVDPYVGDIGNVKWVLRSVWNTICNYRIVCKQAQKMFGHKRGMLKKIDSMLKASGFLWINNKVFDKDLIENAIYIQHAIYDGKYVDSTDVDKLVYAESLIKQYSKASLVITSRIHCALPCLGLDTPLIYLNRVDSEEFDTCRLGGILDFFTVINCAKNSLIPQFELEKKISRTDVFKNKGLEKPYIQKLMRTCEEWIRSF